MIKVASSDELMAADSEYTRLADAGFEGQIEIVIAPGKYRPTNWAFQPTDPKQSPNIDLVIRGSGLVLPNLPNRIIARSVRLEDLIITGRNVATSEIRVTSSFAMKNAMLIDGRAGAGAYTGAMLEVLARSARPGTKTPVEVSLQDTWFIRDFQGQAPMTMLQLAPQHQNGGYFERVTITRSRFLGNAFAVGLGIELARTVVIDDSIFYRTWPSGTLVSYRSTGEVVIKDSVMVVESIERVGQLVASPPMAFQGSKIYARGWTSGAQVPPALGIEPAAILAREAFEPHEPAIAEAAKLPVGPLPSADLRTRVSDAIAAAR